MDRVGDAMSRAPVGTISQASGASRAQGIRPVGGNQSDKKRLSAHALLALGRERGVPLGCQIQQNIVSLAAWCGAMNADCGEGVKDASTGIPGVAMCVATGLHTARNRVW